MNTKNWILGKVSNMEPKCRSLIGPCLEKGSNMSSSEFLEVMLGATKSCMIGGGK